jgi:hypothetical protein
MKVMVWYFVTDVHKVMTTPFLLCLSWLAGSDRMSTIKVLLWSFICNHIDIFLVQMQLGCIRFACGEGNFWVLLTLNCFYLHLATYLAGNATLQWLSSVTSGHFLKNPAYNVSQWFRSFQFFVQGFQTVCFSEILLHSVQRSLYNVWVKTSELRTSVAMQHIKLQQARQTHKLHSILSTHVSPQVFAILSLPPSWAEDPVVQ